MTDLPPMPVTNSKGESDPSALATQLVLRENAWLQKLLESRLEGMDKAIRLLQDDANRTPTPGEMYAEFREKFEGIKQQFTAIKELSIQLDTRNQRAIEAALQSAKESVEAQNKNNLFQNAESNKAFTKQIDAIDSKLNDLKDRVNAAEGKGSGKSEGLSQAGALILGAFAIIAVLISIAALFVSKAS